MLDSDLLFCRQFYMLEVVSSAVYIMNFQFCLPISVPRDFHSPHAREDGSKGENNTHTGSACASMSAYWRKVSLFRDSRRTSVLRREDRRDHYIQEKPMFQMIRAGRDYLCTHQYYWSFEYSGARQRCRGGRVGRQAGRRQAGKREVLHRGRDSLKISFESNFIPTAIRYSATYHRKKKSHDALRCSRGRHSMASQKRKLWYFRNRGQLRAGSKFEVGVFVPRF